MPSKTLAQSRPKASTKKQPKAKSGRSPQPFVGLTSADPMERECAYQEALDAIAQSGAGSSTGAERISALGALVGPKLSHRALWLIGEIAGGGQRARLSNQRSNGSAPHEEVLRALEGIAPTILAALGSDDAATRAGAAFAVGMGLEAFGAAPSALMVLAAKDPEHAVRAVATISLGLFSRSGDTAARAALAAADSGDGLLRGAQWIAAELSGEARSVADSAASALAWAEAEADPELLPWGFGGSALGAGQLSNRPLLIGAVVVGEARRVDLGVALAERLGAIEHRDVPAPLFRALLLEILRLSGLSARFVGRDIPRPEALSKTERSVALALAPCRYLGTISQFGELRLGGLPGDGRCIRRWLGEEPPTALETRAEDGAPRWESVRAAVAAGKSPAEVRAMIVAGLTPIESLRAMSEVMLGAYFLNEDSTTGWVRLTVEEMRQAVGSGGEHAVSWALDFAEGVLSHPSAGTAVQWSAGAVNASHLLVALQLLVKANLPIEPRFDRLIGFAPVDLAREVLEALPAGRRKALAVERIRLGFPAMQWLAMLPLVDLLGSKELEDRFKQAFAASMFDQLPADLEAKLAPFV
jgi:hypothetical protein